ADRDSDKIAKYNVYCGSGVREYWMVDPEEQTVEVYEDESNFLKFTNKYTARDVVKVNALDNCSIDFSKVFR
ncbi:MAG: Uma2 family endonuclease, partial [Eubacterium sp.]|nr:Uma2 family endonuclease [Eubacterium sp.]